MTTIVKPTTAQPLLKKPTVKKSTNLETIKAMYEKRMAETISPSRPKTTEAPKRKTYTIGLKKPKPDRVATMTDDGLTNFLAAQKSKLQSYVKFNKIGSGMERDAKGVFDPVDRNALKEAEEKKKRREQFRLLYHTADELKVIDEQKTQGEEVKK